MKLKIFYGSVTQAIDAFNKWAKGKNLTREVIIHEQMAQRTVELGFAEPVLMIFVYHPEGAIWDSTEDQPIKRTQHNTSVEQVEQAIQP